MTETDDWGHLVGVGVFILSQVVLLVGKKLTLEATSFGDTVRVEPDQNELVGADADNHAGAVIQDDRDYVWFALEQWLECHRQDQSIGDMDHFLQFFCVIREHDG